MNRVSRMREGNRTLPCDTSATSMSRKWQVASSTQCRECLGKRPLPFGQQTSAYCQHSGPTGSPNKAAINYRKIASAHPNPTEDRFLAAYPA